MKKLLHKLAHFFCINSAYQTTEIIGGEVCPAFKCKTCGKID